MNLKHKFLAAMLTAAIAIVPMAGCSDQTAATAAVTVNTASVATESTLSEYFTERDLSGEYDESDATFITLNGSSAEADGSGVSCADGILTITEEGTYIVSGTLEDGQIVVDADETAKVQIVLNGVSITNDDSACILVLSADKVFLTLAEGSENTLSDTGSAYTQQSEDYTVDGVIFSREDLTINGTGTLTVQAGYQHGIVGKDDLKLVSASITVKAAGKGIAANDSIRIASGSYTIDSTDDALHTSNGEEDGKGYIYIADGTFDLSTGDDGIHAETDLLIDGGSILIDKSYEALEGLTITINSGDIDVTASDDGMNAASGSASSSEEDTFQHDGPVMDYHGSSPEADSGLTGLSAAGETAVLTEASASGTAAEFTEASASGSDAELAETAGKGGAMGGMGGMSGMMNEIEQDASLTINGGNIVVNAGGDGLDSNGTLTINGGVTIVNGPTSNGNGAIDCGISATINGGTLIAAGSSGMAENFGSDSTQYSFLYNFSSPVSVGTTIHVTDEAGNEVFTYEAVKDVSSILCSSDALSEGTYTITAGNQSESITISAITNAAGAAGGMMGGMPQGGMPGSSGDSAQDGMPGSSGDSAQGGMPGSSGGAAPNGMPGSSGGMHPGGGHSGPKN